MIFYLNRFAWLACYECTKKGLAACILCKPFKFMARPEGFEPPAYGFEVRCSIQLSYGRLM